MRTLRGTGRRPATALVALTFVVAASVGRCDLPQPKFPTLGSAGDARHAVASERSERPRALAAVPRPAGGLLVGRGADLSDRH